MKSFAIAAPLLGAASAAWAPPAYGGESSAPVASSSAPPAEGYSQPPAGYSKPATSAAWSSSAPSAPAYGASTSSFATYACNPAHSYPNGAECVSTGGSLTLVTPTTSAPGGYGTGSASAPAVTGGYGGSWGSGNGTEGGYGGHGGNVVTQVVTSFETYCPYATTLTYNSKTYTVSSATTLTVTDCPCEVTTPASAYTPEITTKIYTSFTTTCPGKTTVTYGPSTYTVESSTVLTVTDCPGGCTVSEEVPATWVVPFSTTVCPSPSAPTTYTIGTETYPVTDETTISVTAPTSYATYTSVISKPATPTSYVIQSTTYPVSEATTVTYSVPTQQGYTMTGPMPTYAPMPSMPASPVGEQPSGYVPGAPAPSGYAPGANGTSPISPVPAQQTGNSAAKVMAGGAAFAAAVGAFFL